MVRCEVAAARQPRACDIAAAWQPFAAMCRPLRGRVSLRCQRALHGRRRKERSGGVPGVIGCERESEQERRPWRAREKGGMPKDHLLVRFFLSSTYM